MKPLEGLRVPDLTRVLAGPYATALLADLGAELIKLKPPSGDEDRHVGPFRNGESPLFTLSIDCHLPADALLVAQNAARQRQAAHRGGARFAQGSSMAARAIPAISPSSGSTAICASCGSMKGPARFKETSFPALFWPDRRPT